MRIRSLPGWAVLVAVGCAGSGPLGPGVLDVGADLDGDGLADAIETQAALQYLPAWDFDPDEAFFPVSVREWAELGGDVEEQDGSASTAYDGIESLLSAVRAHPAGVMRTSRERYAGRAPCAGRVGCLDAPVFVDVVRARFDLDGRTDLVWLHYWLFFAYDGKPAPPELEIDVEHVGDWEHVCVLAALADVGRPDRPPLGIHFHAHGSLEVAPEAEWVADPACAGGLDASGCAGTFHPRVYVESRGHASFRRPGNGTFGPHRGGAFDPSGSLGRPLLFMTSHGSNAGTDEDEVVREFRGVWGQTKRDLTRSPVGPLVANQACDHDYAARPSRSDWLPACRQADP